MKYIIELEEIEGTDLFKAKGCNTLVFDKNGIEKILKPLEEETEECPFKKDELVEVSDDERDWFLRYFSKKENNMYYTYREAKKSTETDKVISWNYCQKYGTFGGIAKE